MNESDSKKFTKRNLPRGVKLAVQASKEKKGEGITVLDLSEISSFTDVFIIMHGNSARQNKAIYEGIEQELKEAKIRPISKEGIKNAEWILMDYGSFIVHIFSKNAREYYMLEKLWTDAPKLTY
jgi:ribosome-associated protein